MRERPSKLKFIIWRLPKSLNADTLSWDLSGHDSDHGIFWHLTAREAGERERERGENGHLLSHVVGKCGDGSRIILAQYPCRVSFKKMRSTWAGKNAWKCMWVTLNGNTEVKEKYPNCLPDLFVSHKEYPRNESTSTVESGTTKTPQTVKLQVKILLFIYCAGKLRCRG